MGANVEIKVRVWDWEGVVRVVEGLGEFLELEVVLRPDQPTSDGERIARELMAQLNLAEADLVDRAYMDLLEEQRSGS